MAFRNQTIILLLLSLALTLFSQTAGAQYPDGFLERYQECSSNDEISCVTVYEDLAEYYRKTKGENDENYESTLGMALLLAITEVNKEKASEIWLKWQLIPVLDQLTKEELNQKIASFVYIARMNEMNALADRMEIRFGVGESTTTRGKPLAEVEDLDALEKRLRDAIIIGDYEKALPIAVRGTAVAKEKLGPQSDVYHQWNISLVGNAYAAGQIADYLPEAEAYYQWAQSRKKDDLQTFENARQLYGLALQANNLRLEANNLITEGWPSPSSYSSINELEIFFKQREDEMSIGYDIVQRAKALYPFYRRFFTLPVTNEVDRKVYYDRIETFLALSVMQPSLGGESQEERAKLSAWKSKLAGQLRDYRRQQYGRESPQYRQALSAASTQAMQGGEMELALELMLEEFELIWDQNSLELEDISSTIFMLSSMPQYPVSQKFISTYKDQILERYKNDTSLEAQTLRMTMETFGANSASYINEANYARRVKPIEFPNLLEGEEFGSKGKTRQQIIDQLLNQYNPEYLLDFDTDLESAILNDGRNYQDALLNIVRRESKNETLLNTLVTLELQRENFLNGKILKRRELERLAKQDPLVKSRLDANQKKLIAALKRYQEGEMSLYKYVGEISNLDVNSDDLGKELLQGNWTPPAPIAINQLTAALNPQQALVRIYRYAHRSNGKWYESVNYGAVVLTANAAPAYVDLPGNDSLEYEVFNQFLIGVSSVQNGMSYQRFWKAIRKATPNVNEYFLLTEGIYDRIPPAVLYDSSTESHLLESVAITFLTSLNGLLSPDIDRSRLRRALLVGRPHYSEGGSPPPNGKGRYVITDDKGKPIWTDLPYTETEVDSVRQITLNARMATQTLKGADASKATLKKLFQGHDILHLATHGYFDASVGIQQYYNFVPPPDKLRDNDDEEGKEEIDRGSTEFPDRVTYLRDGKGRWGINDSLRWAKYIETVRESDAEDQAFTFWWEDGKDFAEMQRKIKRKSGIVLAGANVYAEESDEGFMLLADFQEMNFSSTQLVVMSACDFGKEELISGDKLAGFRSLLRSQGVKYLISSIWRVEDQDGMQFIVSFYRHWLTEGLSISKAFNAAQREMLRRDIPVVHWGGFVLTKL